MLTEHIVEAKNLYVQPRSRASPSSALAVWRPDFLNPANAKQFWKQC